MGDLNDSPFEHLLHTNYAPSEQESISIKELLASSQRELSYLEATVQSSNERARRLENIKQHIDGYRALLSPIRRLPDEIYQEIFTRCLPRKGFATARSSRAPILLTHICRLWRSLAHSNPWLWAPIPTRPNLSRAVPRSQRAIEQFNWETHITNWVSRSQSLPLSICARDRTSCRDHTPAHLRDLFRLLNDTVPRWEYLVATISGRLGDLQTHLLEGLGKRYNNPFRQVAKLELTLQLNEMRSRQYQVALVELGIIDNTRLREVVLCLGARGSCVPLDSFLPCSQLEILDLEPRRDDVLGIPPKFEYRPHRVYRILQQCPNLVIFRVEVAHPTPHEPYKPAPLIMKRMKHLSLALETLDRQGTLGPTLDFLHVVEFPVLTSMSIRVHESAPPRESWDSEIILHSVFHQLGRSLTSLTLAPGVLLATDLVNALAKTPSLVQLHLKQLFYEADFEYMGLPQDARWGDVVLRPLTPQPGFSSHPHCPQLRYLRWQYNTCFSDHALLNFLAQRAKCHATSGPLKQVHIDFGRGMEEDIRGACSGLVEAGLDLRLRYLSDDRCGQRNAESFVDGEAERWVFNNLLPWSLDHESEPLVFGWG